MSDEYTAFAGQAFEHVCVDMTIHCRCREHRRNFFVNLKLGRHIRLQVCLVEYDRRFESGEFGSNEIVIEDEPVDFGFGGDDDDQLCKVRSNRLSETATIDAGQDSGSRLYCRDDAGPFALRFPSDSVAGKWLYPP